MTSELVTLPLASTIPPNRELLVALPLTSTFYPYRFLYRGDHPCDRRDDLRGGHRGCGLCNRYGRGQGGNGGHHRGDVVFCGGAYRGDDDHREGGNIYPLVLSLAHNH